MPITNRDRGRRPGGAFKRAAMGLLAFVFPDACLSCGAALGIGERHVCDLCRLSIRPSVYARPLPRAHGVPEGTEEESGRALFALGFEGPVRALIHALKYEGRTSVAGDLGSMIAPCLAGGIRRPVDAVVPIPLHRVRLRERGFNQSSLLAARLAAHVGAPLDPTFLARTRATLSQTGLSRSARMENVRGAFEVRRRTLDGAHVLIVDDVVTSGATLAEARRALVNFGASRVTCAAAAGLARDGE